MMTSLLNEAVAMILVASPGSGGLLLDGDMDGLTPGTNPDCDVDAGAWAWPMNYVDEIGLDRVKSAMNAVQAQSPGSWRRSRLLS